MESMSAYHHVRSITLAHSAGQVVGVSENEVRFGEDSDILAHPRAPLIWSFVERAKTCSITVLCKALETQGISLLLRAAECLVA